MAKYQSGFALAVLAATLVAANGANDWSKPCFDGECAYDIPIEGQSATLKLVGAPHAIADITPSAGWVILECDPHNLMQDVRLVCSSEDEEAAGCSHFFLGDGPTHKYVRLPESCGPYPFGRIASFQVDEDQTIPHHAAPKIQRRDGMAPQVFSIRVDDQFEHVDAEKYGKVYAAAVGVNIPGVDTNFAVPQNIGMKEVADAFVVQAMEDTGVKVLGLKATFTYYEQKSDGLLGIKASDPAKEKVEPEQKSGKFDWGSKTEEYKLHVQPEKAKTCERAEIKATLDATLSTKAYGSAAFFGSAGVADLQEKSLIALLSNIAEFSAHVEHELAATVTVEGTLKHEFTILEPKAIPKLGLDLKILKAGLMFGIDGEIHLTAKVGVDVKTGFKWGIDKVGLSIPPSPRGSPYAKDGHFDVSLNRDDDGQHLTGELAMSATPKLIIGIDAPKLKLTLKAWIGFKAGLALVVGLTGGKKRGFDADWYCAKLKAQFEASVGAEGKLFKIFNIPEVDHSFWEKELDLWEHGDCPNPASKRSRIPLQSRAGDLTITKKVADALKCPKKEGKLEKAGSGKNLDQKSMKMKDKK